MDSPKPCSLSSQLPSYTSLPAGSTYVPCHSKGGAYEAVLLALGESARVDAAVCVGELALAVPHAGLVLALVRVAVGEGVLPSAVHRIVDPLTLVDLAVDPSVRALAVLVALDPLALVDVAVGVVVGALTIHVLVAPGTLVAVARLPGDLDAVLEVGHVLRE
eukprot:scaffold91270_cov45-Phaeocystis_antarctica.AAC.1